MKELAAKTRKYLTSKYPTKQGYKFSVTSEYNEITVTILNAPFMAWDADVLKEEMENHPAYLRYDVDKFMTDAHEQVNQFHFKDQKGYTAQMRDLLIDIYQVISADNYIVNEDSDYGSIPNYYIHMNIGTWDKPFVVKEVA